jgi:hypothetical protein
MVHKIISKDNTQNDKKSYVQSNIKTKYSNIKDKLREYSNKIKSINKNIFNDKVSVSLNKAGE